MMRSAARHPRLDSPQQPRVTRPGRIWRYWPAATALLLLACGVSACGGNDGGDTPPPLAWQPCTGAAQAGFMCATSEVPLDHTQPRGERIELALIMRPAADGARRIGMLFFNPGGPGGRGTDSLPAWFDLFPQALRERFDIASFDPRGIGRSTAVRCFANADEEKQFLAVLPTGFPVGAEQVAAWSARYREFDARCGERAGVLLAHVSTADVAHDLEWLRRAAGEPAMNFLGVSYGTLLGAIYANLYPQHVRAMVLDGNIDPIAWSTERDGLSTGPRMGSDLASARTLNAFFELCGAADPTRCAFSAGSAARTRAKFDMLLLRLRAKPVVINGKTLTAAEIAAATSDLLVTVQAVAEFPGWSRLATLLQEIWQASEPGAPAAAAAPVASAVGTPSDAAYNSAGGGLAVECSDSPNPRDPAAYAALAERSAARAGPLGPSWVWADSPCASWPGTAANRYAGPWNRITAQTLLVIGNRFDPETSYESSQVMTQALARARLLTVDGWGHSVLLNPSRCAADIESAYFIDGALPAEGTVCSQDFTPFGR